MIEIASVDFAELYGRYGWKPCIRSWFEGESLCHPLTMYFISDGSFDINGYKGGDIRYPGPILAQMVIDTFGVGGIGFLDGYGGLLTHIGS